MPRKNSKIILFGVILIVFGFFIVRSFVVKKMEHTILCRDCNVVFILTDTLRADHSQPVFEIINNSKLKDTHTAYNFTSAYSAAPWTLPSMMSIFTGTSPSTHGVVNKYLAEDEAQQVVSVDRTAPQLKLLAELLSESGYTTAAFTGGAGIEGVYGFKRGFAEYYDATNFAGFSETVPLANDWLLQHNSSERLFLVVHGYDVHGQYEPASGYDYRYKPEGYEGSLTGSKEEQKELRETVLLEGSLPLAQQDILFLKSLYREKVDKMAEHIQTLIESIAANMNLRKTILVLVADHGEEFMEHGKIDHGHSLYNELLHVPLIVLLPNDSLGEKTLLVRSKNQSIIQIDQQVRTIDIAPTLIDVLGVENHATQQYEGNSLLPIMLGKDKLNRPVFAETQYRYVTNLEAVQNSDGKKLIKDNEEKKSLVFDLKTDPGENMNLVDQKPELLVELEKLLLDKGK